MIASSDAENTRVTYPFDFSEYVRSFGLRHHRTRSLRRVHIIVGVHTNEDLAVWEASRSLKERMCVTNMYEIEDSIHVDPHRPSMTSSSIGGGGGCCMRRIGDGWKSMRLPAVSDVEQERDETCKAKRCYQEENEECKRIR